MGKQVRTIYCLSPYRSIGRLQFTWLKNITSSLRFFDMGLCEAERSAQNLGFWLFTPSGVCWYWIRMINLSIETYFFCDLFLFYFFFWETTLPSLNIFIILGTYLVWYYGNVFILLIDVRIVEAGMVWADLLQLIRETENDDLTCALQRFVCTYSDEIAPLAVEVTKHLVCNFCCYSALVSFVHL